MKDFASFTGGGSDLEKELNAAAKKYDGKNESDLLRDIYARAQEGKRNGTVTNEQIDAFYAQVSPMLDHAKRKKLQKIVQQLKSMD